MSNDTNVKKGALRKKLTKEEQEWLRDFQASEKRLDLKSLARIAPTEEVFTDAKEKAITRRNSMKEDIWNQYSPLHVDARWENACDEALEDLIYSGGKTGFEEVRLPSYDENERREQAKWEEVLNPKIKVNRYTSYDYNKPGFPADEDSLIDLIDADMEADRKRADAKKIKQFPKVPAKLRKKIIKEGA